MATIYKRVKKDGTSRYVVRFTDQRGKKTERSAGSTRKAAELLKVRIERELAEGSYGKNKPEDPYFSEFCDRFLEIKKRQVKSSTLLDYSRVIDNHLIPFFRNVYLSDITPSLIQDFISELAKKDISSATQNKIFRCLRVVIHQAQVLELINRDPTYAIKAPRIEKKEMHYLTQEEVTRLLEVANGRLKAILAVACFSGLRQGEILALRWMDIDFESRIIKVVRTYDPDYGFSEPKSKDSRRAVPMPSILLRILNDHHACVSERHPENLVFTNSKGNPINRSNLVRREFEIALIDAGIRRIRFHDLRHTYASLCIAAGMDPKALQRAMGHSSIQVTMDIYAHLFPGSYDIPLSRLDEMFSQVSSL